MRYLLLMLLTATGMALEIPATAEGIRHIGRFTADQRFAWTGAGFEVGFTGTSITVRLQGNKSWMAAVIDDGEPIPFELAKDKTDFEVAKGLAAGDHKILIFHRTEGHSGPVKFLGLSIDDGAKIMAVPAPERRISILGDSITCGYGNEAAKPEDGFTLPQENGYLTYWAIAAREFKADQMCVAFSGKGIWRNRSGKDPFADTMPVMWERALPFDPGSTIDHNAYIPDVHIINLGTNDTAIDMPPREPFVEAVLKHIAVVRETAPKCHIFLCVGPMLGGKGKETIAGHYQAVIAEANDPLLHYLEFDGQKKDGIGGHWHPNTVTHQRMADKLIEAIRTELKW